MIRFRHFGSQRHLAKPRKTVLASLAAPFDRVSARYDGRQFNSAGELGVMVKAKLREVRSSAVCSPPRSASARSSSSAISLAVLERHIDLAGIARRSRPSIHGAVVSARTAAVFHGGDSARPLAQASLESGRRGAGVSAPGSALIPASLCSDGLGEHSGSHHGVAVRTAPA